MKAPVRIILIVCGSLFVVLGAIGMLLPLLPTTPFLLLAAACFARGSSRLHHKLMTNRWFGDYIRNYQEGRGVTLRHKVLALMLLWLTMGYSAGFATRLWPVRLLLLAIAIGVTAHLLVIKTYKPSATGKRNAVDDPKPPGR